MLNTTQIKQIESPLSSFNNIQIEITQQFEKIVFIDKPDYVNNKNKSLLALNNLIIFDSNSITLMGFIKLVINPANNELLVRISKPLDINDLSILNNIYKNWDIVSLNFFRYIQMYNNIAKNYNEVPTELIKNIIICFNKHLKSFIPGSVLNKEIDNFLIPFKNKISNKYDNDKHYIQNIYNRFQYILKIQIINKNTFEYKIIRVLSSELNENKNELNNLKYLEQDLIKKGQLKNHQFNGFINKLFNYGELIN